MSESVENGADVVRHDVTFASGTDTCSAWLYLPPSDGPHPVVVMAHGLGGVRQMRLDAFADRFSAAGYACLVFDYRHFGASGGQPRQLLDIGRQLADWTAALAYVRDRAELDPTRIALWGTSFGGGHAALTAARDHDVAAVIAQCPFTDGIASARVKNPVSALRSGWLAARDLVGSWAGRDPVMIPMTGAPRDGALMTSSDSPAGHLALLPSGVDVPDEVCARFALQITRHRPGRSFGDITCPALFCLCDHDTLAPPDVAERQARRAPHAEIARYPYGHFDIYVGGPFEQVVADQLAFLRRAVPVHTG